jgi:heme exporter protein CcmD
MSHTGYIVAAYGFAAFVVGALILWSILQYRGQARALEALEARLGRG